MLCSSPHSKQPGRLAQKARAAGSAIGEQQHRQRSQQSHPAGSFHPAATPDLHDLAAGGGCGLAQHAQQHAQQLRVLNVRRNHAAGGANHLVREGQWWVWFWGAGWDAAAAESQDNAARDEAATGSNTFLRAQTARTWPSVPTATSRLVGELPSWMASITRGRISGTSARSCAPATVASSPSVISTATSNPSSAGGGRGARVAGTRGLRNIGDRQPSALPPRLLFSNS